MEQSCSRESDSRLTVQKSNLSLKHNVHSYYRSRIFSDFVTWRKNRLDFVSNDEMVYNFFDCLKEHSEFQFSEISTHMGCPKYAQHSLCQELLY